jgi:hypothetical protein
MTLRDRLRRWWSPPQWEDDHPAERKQGEKPPSTAIGRFCSNPAKNLYDNPEGRATGSGMDYERDSKKPR